jgi:SET domain-containing protein
MQSIPSLYYAASPLGGRGVFTAAPIPEGSLIEICPVIVCPPEDLAVIHSTRLHDYYFLWGEEQDACAIALGYGSLYNHSFSPNTVYMPDFDEGVILFHSMRDIEAGEELTVNYNGDPTDTEPVWFDPEQGGDTV